MELLDLPSELLVNIVNFVGPGYFREDVGRTAVSKVWYNVARPVLLSYVRLSTSSLLVVLRSLRNQNALAAAQRFTAAVDLRLD